MRGKKIDFEFVSEFITHCVQSGYDTPEAIVSHARKNISFIDEAIKAVELKKIERSKLLDVIASFEKSPPSKVVEAKALPFFNMHYPDICNTICQSLKVGPLTLKDLEKNNHSYTNILFCVKQLLENKIISKSGNYLLRGSQFNNYLKFVIKD